MYRNDTYWLNKGDPTICDNVDKPGRQYAKWNKPDTKRKTAHDVTCVESKNTT